ncbi:MAG: PAS domain S-box protein, partial [Thermodesulfobacteriota bacterium]
MRIVKLRSSIAAQLVLAMLGVTLFLILLTTAIQLHLNYSHEMELLQRRIKDIEQSYLPAIANSVWLTDYETLEAQVMGIQRLPEICYVEVEVEGRKMTAVGDRPPEADEALIRTFPLSYRHREKNVALGTLTLYGDLQAIHRRLLGEVWWVLASRLFVIAVISAVLFFLYYGLVGRHLRAMAAYLRSFDQGRMETPLTLAARVPARKEEMNELDQVVHSFNEMRQNLKRTFDSLHQVNVELMRENRERVKAEAALRESEQRYTLLMDTIPEVFWMVSADFRKVFYISPAYEAVWGRSCESLLAEPRSWFDAVVAEDQGPLAAVIDTVVKGEALTEQIDFPEYRVERPDGSRRWIKAKAVPLRDETGAVWGFAGLCEDVSSRKETEEKLRQAQKMEAIGTLAGGIAHDFNNILAAILGYADLLRCDIEPADPRRSNVEQIIQAGNRAKALVQQILAFSRKSEAQRRPVMLAPIVKEALKLLRASIPTTIEITQHIGDPEGTVLADPIQIHQVVINLCTNASHAMEERGGTLAVALEAVELASAEAAA